jgi:hypothetical protein
MARPTGMPFAQTASDAISRPLRQKAGSAACNFMRDTGCAWRELRHQSLDIDNVIRSIKFGEIRVDRTYAP